MINTSTPYYDIFGFFGSWTQPHAGLQAYVSIEFTMHSRGSWSLMELVNVH